MFVGGTGGARGKEQLEQRDCRRTVVLHPRCESWERISARDSHEEMIISWQFSPGFLLRDRTQNQPKEKVNLNIDLQKVLTHATVDCDWLLPPCHWVSGTFKLRANFCIQVGVFCKVFFQINVIDFYQIIYRNQTNILQLKQKLKQGSRGCD